MLKFKDFVPQMTSPDGFLRLATFEALDEALTGANRWLAEQNIRPVNVETVVLPNIWAPHEEGSTDPALHIGGEMSSRWHQFIRVWYEAE